MGVVIWGIEDEPDWFIGYVKEELENEERMVEH